MANYINLDDDLNVRSVFRSTGETVRSWFSTAKPTKNTTRKESICDFAKQNNIRALRARMTKFGAVRVSVLLQDGSEIYNYGSTFSLAFQGLKDKFVCSQINKISL